VSEASGGHDPVFRKGVRRGVKARFQNVFDVGGFYVECYSEKPSDSSEHCSSDLPVVDITSRNIGGNLSDVEDLEMSKGKEEIFRAPKVIKTKARTAIRSLSRLEAAGEVKRNSPLSSM
jgi:hypothetical protein